MTTFSFHAPSPPLSGGYIERLAASTPGTRRTRADQILIEADGAVIVVSGGFDVSGEHQDVLAVDAGALVHELVQTASEQGRAAEQQHRDRDLCRDDPSAGGPARREHAAGAGCALQSGCGMDPGRPERRPDRTNRRREGRHHDREQEDPAAHAGVEIDRSDLGWSSARAASLRPMTRSGDRRSPRSGSRPAIRSASGESAARGRRQSPAAPRFPDRARRRAPAAGSRRWRRRRRATARPARTGTTTVGRSGCAPGKSRVRADSSEVVLPRVLRPPPGVEIRRGGGLERRRPDASQRRIRFGQRDPAAEPSNQMNPARRGRPQVGRIRIGGQRDRDVGGDPWGHAEEARAESRRRWCRVSGPIRTVRPMTAGSAP